MTFDFVYSVVFKLTCLLLAGLLLDAVMHRRWVLPTAALWNAVLVAILAFWPAMLLVPQWVLPVLPPDSQENHPWWELASPSTNDMQIPALAPISAETETPLVASAADSTTAIFSKAETVEKPASVVLLSRSGGVLSRIGPVHVFATIYGLGVWIVLVRLLASWLAINSLRRHASPIDDREWLDRFDFWQAQLGQAKSSLRPPIRLLHSDQVDVPVALGVRHRAVIIPTPMLSEISAAERDAILLHELAHCARADCAWQWVQRIVEAMLWCHPLIWMVRRRIAFIRERACDDFALYTLGDHDSYAQTLLEVACRITRRPDLGLGLTMIRRTNLAYRLRAIQQSSGSAHWDASRLARRLFALGSIFSAVVLASVVLGRAASEEPAAPAAAPNAPASAPTADENKEAPASAGAIEKPKAPKEIAEIEQLKSSLARLTKIAWTAREETKVSRTPGNVSLTSWIWIQAARDGQDWAILVKESGESLLEGKTRSFSTFQAANFKGKQVLQINCNDDTLRGTYGDPPVPGKQFDDPKLIPLPTDSKSIQVLGSVNGVSPISNLPPWHFLQSGKIMFGYLEVFHPLSEQLSGGKVDPEKMRADLPDCVAVTSVGSDGTITAWLDAKQCFLPRRIEVRKAGDDKLGTVSINKIRPIDDGKRGIWPPSQLVEYRQVIDSVKLEQFKGMPVMQQWSETIKYIYEDAQQLTFQHDYVNESFHDPQPDELLPAIKITDHTVVMINGSYHSGYQWFGGKIVRDEEAMGDGKKTPLNMKIKVVSAKGEPVAGATIDASVWTKEPFQHNRYYRCNEQGRAEIELPKTFSILRLWARKPTYVPLFANWDIMQENNSIIPLPEEFTFQLEPGTIIGGLIQNEEDRPIAGARVQVELVTAFRSLTQAEPRPTFDSWLAYGIAARVTDAEGRWTLDNVPPGDDVEVKLRLTHPEHKSDYEWGGLQKEQNITMKSLREQTAKMVMHRGVAITGTVSNAENDPVADALVVWGEDPYRLQGSQEVRTDSSGHYRFPPLPAGPMTVTVVAKDWAPEQKKITIAPDMGPVDFSLKPGKTIRVRFVDSAGASVGGVRVGIEQWREGKALYNHRHSNVLDSRIPYEANEKGEYEWTWAPGDPITFTYYKEGYLRTRERSFTASEGEQTIQLGARISR